MCPNCTLLNEVLAKVPFTSQILYCFDIKQQLLTVISAQKPSVVVTVWTDRFKHLK